MKYHYVYIIINKINHKFYIGKHSTNNLDDGYMGSGTAINKAIQKYGIENFSKRILCFCNSAEDALVIEEFLVTDYIVSRNDSYNLIPGGIGRSSFKHSEDTKKRISEAHLGKKFTDKHRNNISESKKGKQSPRKGVKLSEEQKQKMSNVHKGKFTGEKNPMYGVHRYGKDAPMFGKHFSTEAKQKISESNKGKKRTEEQKQKLSDVHKGKKRGPYQKYLWITPIGEIVMMDKRNAKVHHPDWVLYEQN